MRLADEDDRETVMALHCEVFKVLHEQLSYEPLQLLAPEVDIFEDYEVWLLEDDGKLLGVMILEPRAKDLLVWSVAVMPDAQGRGIGRLMMSAAELRAGQFGHTRLSVHLEHELTRQLEWFKALGFKVERIEELSDRALAHLAKVLPGATKH